MEIALDRKFLSTFKLINSYERLCEAGSDIVVPDTKDDIYSVIYSDARYKIRSKDTEAGKLIVHGEIEVSIAYITEAEKNIEILNKDIPFECRIEDEKLDKSCTAICDMQLMPLEIRILNPRKILINAQINISCKCYCISDFVWYEAPPEAQKKIYFKTDTAKAQLINIASEKVFSLEDESALNLSDDARIISSAYTFSADSAEAVGSKLIIKGHTEINMLIFNDGKLEKAGKSISFSQIFELTERDVVPEYTVSVLPTGDLFEISDGRILLEIHAVMQLVCSEIKEINYISDGYACGGELKMSSYKTAISTAKRTEILSEKAKLELNTDCAVSSIENISVKTGKARLGENEISVPIYADVMYLSDEGQLRCGRTDTVLKIDADIDMASADNIDVRISDIRSDINGNKIDISCEAALEIDLINTESIDLVSSSEYVESDTKEQKPSMYMCRATENDLWSIAKKYSSDIDLISELNSISSDDEIKDKLLLVPRII